MKKLIEQINKFNEEHVKWNTLSGAYFKETTLLFILKELKLISKLLREKK